MATPHVAGVAARYLQGSPSASPSTVRNAVVTAATTGRLSGIPAGTSNRLLFWSSAQ
jgi:subtilisin family serine protease